MCFNVCDVDLSKQCIIKDECLLIELKSQNNEISA